MTMETVDLASSDAGGNHSIDRAGSPHSKIILIYAFEKYWGKKPRVPLSLMYLASALREEFEPIILDTRVCDDLEMMLRQHLPDALFVGFSVMIGNQIRFSLAVGEIVRRIRPEVPIIWGGPFATLAATQCALDPRIDIIVKGDGEATVLSLARSFRNGTALDAISNICFGVGNLPVRQVIDTGSVSTPSLLGGSIPAWDMIDVADYKDFEVAGSRGCAFECSFCYVHVMHASKWRPRGPEEVVDEIMYLVRQFNATKIQFVDDNFFQKRKQARRIAELLVAQGSPVRWEATCRANDLATFDDDFFALIVESGCKEVFVGAESGSDSTLLATQKGVLPSMTRIACARAERFGLQVKLLWMIGVMGESEGDRLVTMDFIDTLKTLFPKTVRISSFGIYTPYPGIQQTDEAVLVGQKLPENVDGWADFYHDNANQTFLSLHERRLLENLMWIQRYAHERNRRKAGWADMVDTLLRFDAKLRWRLRFFRFCPEWRIVRIWYNRHVQEQLRTLTRDETKQIDRASILVELDEMIKVLAKPMLPRTGQF